MIKSLRQTIDKLVTAYSPVAVEKQSFFLNDIKSEIPIDENQDSVYNLLNSLFYCIARCTEDSYIKINAACGSGITELIISTNASVSNYAFLQKFEHLKMLAKKVGGMLEITGKERAMIIFSFINPIHSNAQPKIALQPVAQLY